ncbi:hypothetical protein C8Q80DRAFT_1124909 [Daedaleopsis nitida]|nr:hypothetical protein C8Q80DRAFT_1124909 [Daedaleopsis nitida]
MVSSTAYYYSSSHSRTSGFWNRTELLEAIKSRLEGYKARIVPEVYHYNELAFDFHKDDEGAYYCSLSKAFVEAINRPLWSLNKELLNVQPSWLSCAKNDRKGDEQIRQALDSIMLDKIIEETMHIKAFVDGLSDPALDKQMGIPRNHRPADNSTSRLVQGVLHAMSHPRPLRLNASSHPGLEVSPRTSPNTPRQSCTNGARSRERGRTVKLAGRRVLLKLRQRTARNHPAAGEDDEPTSADEGDEEEPSSQIITRIVDMNDTTNEECNTAVELYDLHGTILSVVLGLSWYVI